MCIRDRVNTARKAVIDEAGLEKALEERTDLKYITDVAPEMCIRDRLSSPRPLIPPTKSILLSVRRSLIPSTLSSTRFERMVTSRTVSYTHLSG